MASMPHRSRSTRPAGVAIAALLLCVALPARADAGVPMLAVIWPASWLLLVPIVLLEAWMARRMLRTTTTQSLNAASSANCVSTLLGIPVTWGVLVLAQFALGGRAFAGVPGTPGARAVLAVTQAPWMQVSAESCPEWMTALALLVLCVPFYLMSVLVEGLVAREVLKDVPRREVWRWAWKANAASYGLIVLLLVIQLVLAVHAHGFGVG